MKKPREKKPTGKRRIKPKASPVEKKGTGALLSRNLASFEQANLLTNLLRLLVLVLVIAGSLYIYSIRDRVGDFAAYGYPGVFLIALLANATVFLPAPGVAVVFAMGGVFNPLGVALAAGTGGALGELTGYLAGFGGAAAIERSDLYHRIRPWVAKYGVWAILVFSAVPNPFFDLAGIAAGAAKIPPWKFLVFCWLGQIIKMGLFAYAGLYSIHWVDSFLKH